MASLGHPLPKYGSHIPLHACLQHTAVSCLCLRAQAAFPPLPHASPCSAGMPASVSSRQCSKCSRRRRGRAASASRQASVICVAALGGWVGGAGPAASFVAFKGYWSCQSSGGQLPPSLNLLCIKPFPLVQPAKVFGNLQSHPYPQPTCAHPHRLTCVLLSTAASRDSVHSTRSQPSVTGRLYAVRSREKKCWPRRAASAASSSRSVATRRSSSCCARSVGSACSVARGSLRGTGGAAGCLRAGVRRRGGPRGQRPQHWRLTFGHARSPRSQAPAADGTDNPKSDAEAPPPRLLPHCPSSPVDVVAGGLHAELQQGAGLVWAEGVVQAPAEAPKASPEWRYSRRRALQHLHLPLCQKAATQPHVEIGQAETCASRPPCACADI